MHIKSKPKNRHLSPVNENQLGLGWSFREKGWLLSYSGVADSGYTPLETLGDFECFSWSQGLVRVTTAPAEEQTVGQIVIVNNNVRA